MRRSAFTLMELLVVITVILILVGIMVPVVAVVRRQARDVTCTNNLQQLGIGITAFRQANNNFFPESLSQLFSAGQPLAGESPRVLLCPHDTKKGADSLFNRDTLSSSNVSELYDKNHSFSYSSQPLSYMFEAANVALANDSIAQNWFGYLYGPPPEVPTGTTWADAKARQLKRGHNGGPYRPEDFPILRCFWHATWKGSTDVQKKVLNLTWAMTTYWSIPEWENQIP